MITKIVWIVVGLWIGNISATPSHVSPADAKQGAAAIESHLRHRDQTGRQIDIKQYIKDRGNVCSYEGLCDYFALNATKPYLYKSADGSGIPNSAFLKLDQSVKECLGRGSSQELVAAQKEFEKSLDDQERKKFQAVLALAEDDGLLSPLGTKTDLAEGPPSESPTDYTESGEQALDLIGGVLPDPAVPDLTVPEPAVPEPEVADPAPVESPETLKPGWKQVLDATSHQKYERVLALEEEAIKTAGPAIDKWNPFANDYLLNSDLFSKEKNQADFDDRAERAAGVFESARGDLIQFLKEKRNGSNDADIALLIKRVETVAFKLATPGSPMPIGCRLGTNGYYNQQDHTISVCPQALRFPVLALRELIGHELGHTIDPCGCTCPLTARVETPKEQEGDDTAMDSLDSTALLSGQGPDYRTVSPKGAMPLGLQRLEAVFSGDDRILLNDQKIVAHSVKTNPFQSVVDCLTRKTSVQARVHDPKVVAAEYEKAMRAYATTDERPAFQRTADAYRKFIRIKSACNDEAALQLQAGSDQRAEAFADWVSRNLGVRHLKNRVVDGDGDGRREREAMEYLAFNADTCPAVQIKAHAYFQSLADKAGCPRPEADAKADREDRSGEMMVIHQYLDSHPSSADRVDRIFLADPQMAQMLGCPATKGTEACL